MGVLCKKVASLVVVCGYIYWVIFGVVLEKTDIGGNPREVRKRYCKAFFFNSPLTSHRAKEKEDRQPENSTPSQGKCR